ncbi:MAG TPA: CHAD domain-containing protein [Blastocatellia bacterium]|nr:CHAD domain-containing protein [Blastocatellia bacterium]
MESVITTTEPEASPASGDIRPSRPLTDIITSQVTLLASYLTPVMESDDAEAIHKMRVTTRRLQASLDLLQTAGDQKKIRKLKKKLRDWRRVLSPVRNYDVFLLVIEKEGASRSSKRRQSFEHLKSILQKRRARRLAKARRYLKHVNLAEICSKLGLDAELWAPKKSAVEADQSPAQETQTEGPHAQTAAPLPEIIGERAIALRAAERIEQRLSEFQLLAAQSHPTTNPAELHQLRIAAKRLRYLLELVSGMGYGDAVRALAWLRLLQDRIGDWHDLEAIEEEIISIVSRRKFLKENIGESSRMLQAASHLQSKKKTLVAKLFPVKVPRTLQASSRRLVRSLRRKPARPATNDPYNE